MQFLADLFTDLLELSAVMAAETRMVGQFAPDLDARQFGRQGHPTAMAAVLGRLMGLGRLIKVVVGR